VLLIGLEEKFWRSKGNKKESPESDIQNSLDEFKFYTSNETFSPPLEKQKSASSRSQ
jgi:hypothetical protein